MEHLTEMLKGVLEGCVLEILARGENYGYEITRTLNELGFTDVVEGTVYTILLRLEKSGAVDARRSSSTQGPPRKVYTLSEAGRQRREDFWRKWTFLCDRLAALKGEDDL